MAQQFTKIGGTFFRQDDSGNMYAVTDTDTLSGLKAGSLPYNAIENNRGLTFSGQTTAANTAPATTATDSGSFDIGSLIKEKLAGALNNYKGVTSTADLETRRQELLRKQLLSDPYSAEGESNMTGSQKLSLLRSRGTEFEPEIKSLEDQIVKARQGDSESMTNLQKLVALAKDAGVLGAEGGYQSALGKEYADYVANEKSLGKKNIMSLNEYADMDANRKRSIAGIVNDSGLNTKETAVFNSLADKQNKSPLIMANDRTIVLKTIAKELKSNPKSSSLQLSFIYSFIQMLDTYQSAVREGEIGLMQGTQGLADKIRVLPDQINQGTILSDKVINNYINTANILTNSIQSAANVKKKQFSAQAAANGSNVKNAWDSYSSAVDATSSSSNSAPKTIRVKRKSDGATGSIPESEFNSAKYTKI